MDRAELSLIRHWAVGGHTHCLAFLFILCPSALQWSQSHSTVSVWFFSLLVLRRDGISLNRSSSTPAQPHHGFRLTTWRINLLQKEGQSHIFGAVLSPSLEPVGQNRMVLAVPGAANTHGPPPHCRLWCTDTNVLAAPRLSLHVAQTSYA